jgi:hypothetical protein
MHSKLCPLKSDIYGTRADNREETPKPSPRKEPSEGSAPSEEDNQLLKAGGGIGPKGLLLHETSFYTEVPPPPLQKGGRTG